MWERAILKENAKYNFKRFYKQSVIVCLIVYLLSGIFEGGYNSATKNVNNNQQQYTTEYIEGQKVELNNGVTQESNFFVKFTPEGIMMKFMDNMYRTMINPSSGTKVFIVTIIVAALIITVVLKTLILNPITIGKNNFFMGIREGERKIGDIFFLFEKSNFIKPAITILFVELYTTLWTLLLIIPGVIKGYEYKMIPYILSENPSMDRKRAFEISRHIMNGQKWEAFVLDLSFIGWHLLSAFTFGILSIFYVNPYVEATYAELYSVLREVAIKDGFVETNELPGFDS